MKNRYVSSYGSLCLRPYLKEPARPHRGSRTGDIREHKISSKFLSDRTIVVYLPPGYSDKDTFLYPLAILQDGQNIFDADTSVFGVEWSVDETAERLIIEQEIRPIVLVAVYNSPERILEYTPFRDPVHGGGGAEVYEQFLIHELLPFLQERYSLSGRAENRAVIGSSLGGLLALHLGWKHPEVFGIVAALSPSLWWGQRGFITSLASGPPPVILPKIWLDAGTAETDQDDNDNGIPDLLDDLRTMRAVLLAQGYVLDRTLFYSEVEGQTHDEASWASRIGDVLKAFYPKYDTRLEFV